MGWSARRASIRPGRVFEVDLVQFVASSALVEMGKAGGDLAQEDEVLAVAI